jgi:Plasmid pRiA4b ORF-3-like protein
MKAYQFKIELDNVYPPIYRRFIIPATIPFRRFHDVIQEIMGWSKSHLYEFIFRGHPVTFTNNFEEIEMYDFYKKHIKEYDMNNQYCQYILKMPMKSSINTKIDRYVEKEPRFQYVYDLGDDWEHTITLEEVFEDYPHKYPVCLDYEGACPPENVGGTGGFAHFLKVWNDPKHPEHKALRLWGETKGYGKTTGLDDLNTYLEHHYRLKR